MHTIFVKYVWKKKNAIKTYFISVNFRERGYFDHAKSWRHDMNTDSFCSVRSANTVNVRKCLRVFFLRKEDSIKRRNTCIIHWDWHQKTPFQHEIIKILFYTLFYHNYRKREDWREKKFVGSFPYWCLLMFTWVMLSWQKCFLLRFLSFCVPLYNKLSLFRFI